MARLALFVFGLCIFTVAWLNFVRANDDAEQESVEGHVDNEEGRSFQPNGPDYSPNQNALPLTECYVCTDCPKVHENTTTKLCPMSRDRSKDSCVVYVEKYKHMNRPWYIRGCASERGNCADVRRAHSIHDDIVKLSSCHDCQGSLCNTNGGSRTGSDVIAAIISLIVTPIFAKYTLA